MPQKLKVKVRDRWYTVEVIDLDSSPVRVLVDGESFEVDVGQKLDLDSKQAQPAQQPQEVPSFSPAPVKVFYSPMPGVIVSVAVAEGDQVITGDQICILEAMKMQQSLRADWTGMVKKVHVTPGQQIREGDPIAELE